MTVNYQQMPTKKDEDAHEAWVLRAGAELWKAVVAEAQHPADDTQKALAAVRAALDCARRLRCCSPVAAAQERELLSLECAQAAENQRLALRQWGQGRGMHWGEEWGTQWGEALLPDTPAPAEAGSDHAQNRSPANTA